MKPRVCMPDGGIWFVGDSLLKKIFLSYLPGKNKTNQNRN